MDTPSRDEMVLRLSRILDQWGEERLGDDPDWGPLEEAIPREWCGGFMWMARIEEDGVAIELYKHGITRRYLNLDHSGRAWRYTGAADDSYEPTTLSEAIDHVFEGLEEMGYDRETDYDEQFVLRKHQALAEAGWTVISTASLDTFDRDLDVVTLEE
jgi:hypothetical protein